MAVPVFLKRVCAKEKEEQETQRFIRPADLPIYDKPDDIYEVRYECADKSELEKTVGSVRQQLIDAYASTQPTRDRIEHIAMTGQAHTMGQIQSLREEENLPGRVGAITAGSLLGILVGSLRRKGALSRLLHGAVAGAGVAALLYPDEAAYLATEVFEQSKIYGNIGYNFAFGVEPQNGQVTKTGNLEETKISDEVVKVVNNVEFTEDIPAPQPVGEDKGQSSSEDNDMYTTRS